MILWSLAPLLRSTWLEKVPALRTPKLRVKLVPTRLLLPCVAFAGNLTHVLSGTAYDPCLAFALFYIGIVTYICMFVLIFSQFAVYWD